jgi:hypothetical protein
MDEKSLSGKNRLNRAVASAAIALIHMRNKWLIATMRGCI